MNKTISDEINWARDWVRRQIEAITKIENGIYRKILFLSVLDAIVQHQENVGAKNQKEFALFLQTYSYKYKEILNAHCPITLYYDNLALLSDEKLELEEYRIYFANDKEAVDEAQRILKILKNKEKAKTERHQYAWLIYAMRNKLVHEMSTVGCLASFLTEDSDPIPHMVVMDSIDGIKLSPCKWTLMIPEPFIWEVGQSAIENYLNECEEQQKHPLSKMEATRKSRFAWYD